MDLLVTEQIWGLFMFFLGAGVLSLCNHWEYKEDLWASDRRNRYKPKKKKKFLIPRGVRGTFLTFTGCLLSFTGITMVFLHIS